jgi:hypothetical protein
MIHNHIIFINQKVVWKIAVPLGGGGLSFIEFINIISTSVYESVIGKVIRG